MLANASKKASQIILSTTERSNEFASKRESPNLNVPHQGVPQISITPSEDDNDLSSSCQSPKSLIGKEVTPTEAAIVQSEMEAAKLLFQLGIPTERLNAPYNNDARNSITGAYRIMLHQLQR